VSSTLGALRERLPTLDIDLDPPSLAAHACDASGLEGAAPVAILKPRTAPEVQALVTAARDLGLRLQPVSSRGAHHRGDTLCGPDTAVVDMQHFNCIIRVDRRNRVCLFEAAVGFPELQSAVMREGLRLMLPLAPRPGKSALAAYLEREPTMYPKFQWDNSDPLLCTEVVFGTGELFRTGAAAGPGTLEEQWAAGDAQKNPMGPGQSDLMRILQGAQGTIGIVTWCSVKCEPLPTAETLHVLGSDRLEPLVRIAYGLLRRNHADMLFLVDAQALAAVQASNRAEYGRQRSRGAAWSLVYSLSAPHYYPEEKLRYVRREIDVLVQQHGVSSQMALSVSEVTALHTRLTRPDLAPDRPFWKCAGLEATRELFFMTTLNRVEGFVAVAREASAAAGLQADDVLTYVQPLVGGRMCHVEFDFAHAAADHNRINRLVVELAWTLRCKGAFFSRPYGPLNDVAFADTSAATLVPRVKRLFDPDGILSPGCLTVPARAAEPAGGDAHADQ
jgi:FAD/FMN-containing dehydrogenase